VILQSAMDTPDNVL